MATDRMEPGDTLVFYFSGHGGQQPDEDGEELDGRDETLLSYDGAIVDDELNDIWRRFPAGSRIVMISDSCNSGTNYRLRGQDLRDPSPINPMKEEKVGNMKARLIHLGGCRDRKRRDGPGELTPRRGGG